MNFFFYGIGPYLPCLNEYLLTVTEGMTSSIVTVLCAFGAMIIPYLLGSVNTAVLISKYKYHEDIREFGSGNAGSTNMLRTYGKKDGFLTFGGDLLKAAVAVIAGYLLFGPLGGPIAGFFVVFGHMFPVFCRFHGGKGVACLAMVILLQSPITLLILLAVFVVIVAGTKFISLGSIMSALLYPLVINAFVGTKIPLTTAMAAITAAFVVFMHRENIKRLREGKESKLNFSKTEKKSKKS